MSCYDGEDTEPCQGRGECVENIQQHPFTGELTTGYICRCGYPYQLVGTAKCLPLNCVSTQAGVATECGTGGVCESSGSQFSCRCLSGFVQLTDGHCTAPACRQNDGALACSDIGACVSGGEDPTNPNTYYCQCPMSYSSGDYCEVCDNQRGTTINGKCVAKSCVADNTVCSNNGDCVLEGLLHTAVSATRGMRLTAQTSAPSPGAGIPSSIRLAAERGNAHPTAANVILASRCVACGAFPPSSSVAVGFAVATAQPLSHRPAQTHLSQKTGSVNVMASRRGRSATSATLNGGLLRLI